MSIKGKVAWITASGGGIAEHIAMLFAKEGAKLVLCDINKEGLDKVAAACISLGAEVLAVPYDAGSIEDTDNVFKQAISRFGTIDILVNNVGIAGPTDPIENMSVADWDDTMAVNLRSCFYCTKLVVPGMIKNGGGKIVNIGSIAGKRPHPNRSAYSTSKMGMIGFTRTAADELGKHEITVNLVCPGPVIGPRIEFAYRNRAKAKGITYEELLVRENEGRALKRMVPPEDIASMVLFLSDAEKSNSITGQDYNVNCGATYD